MRAGNFYFFFAIINKVSEQKINKGSRKDFNSSLGLGNISRTFCSLTADYIFFS